MKLLRSMKWMLIGLAASQGVANASLDVGDIESVARESKMISAMRNSVLSAGSVIALNRETALNGRMLPQGSELIVDETGDLALVSGAEVIKAGVNINDLGASEYTVLSQNERTGQLEAYNLPGDFKVAGPGRHRRRRGGVTNCYHVVKQLVHRRISLTGVAAYMAAPQLRAAGWRRYADYGSAPHGSVCVFGRGGKRTSSGGHVYGHVGVKGAGGIANPASGFALGRPFLGCWSER